MEQREQMKRLESVALTLPLALTGEPDSREAAMMSSLSLQKVGSFAGRDLVRLCGWG